MFSKKKRPSLWNTFGFSSPLKSQLNDWLPASLQFYIYHIIKYSEQTQLCNVP